MAERGNTTVAEQLQVGLCATCQHMRRIQSDRGTCFYRCERSAIDASFPKYPRLPVTHCSGHEPEGHPPVRVPVKISSTGIKANVTTTASGQENALHAIEKALALLQSVHTLEGTDKDGVEHLLEVARENLKTAEAGV